MPDVELTIQNYRFALNCPNGQEDHVKQLGQAIEERIKRNNPNNRPMDIRSLLTLAMTLEHDAAQLKEKIALLEAKEAAANAAHLVPESLVCNELSEFTAQIEKIASFVERN